MRRSETEVARLMRSDDTLVLVLLGLDPLVKHSNPRTELAWLPARDAARVCGRAERTESLLGSDESGTVLVAWNVDPSQMTDTVDALSVLNDERFAFVESREAAEALARSESGMLAQARSNLDWHSRHRFCGRCGCKTGIRRGGQVRRCVDCKAEHFPRTDPVVITVVSHGDRCLLGQSAGRLRSMRMYSALAGFMDQGEAMEEAVRREVKEEAGIEVGEVEYHSSQPWPFPSSLMIGSHAQALTTEIDIDDFEMTDVRWFDRSDVLLALERKHPDLRVPGPIAIAHHLIKSWANGEAGDWSD